MINFEDFFFMCVAITNSSARSHGSLAVRLNSPIAIRGYTSNRYLYERQCHSSISNVYSFSFIDSFRG